MQQPIKPGFKLVPLILAVQLACAPLLFSSIAHADNLVATQQYDVSPGPLATALTRFAQQSGVAISVNAAEIKNLHSQGLKGTYSVEDGFNKILAGTGYGAEKTAAGYALRKSSSVREDAGQGALPEVSVTASSSRESRALSEGTRSYAARAVTIGKGEQSLRDTPQSVSVITRQRMDDQNLTTLDSVLMQTTGVTRQFRNYGHSAYYSRGFGLDNFMLDGVPMGYYGGLGIAPDTAIFDRVEVLRGAPGLLIGNGDPGGTVNMARKRPMAEKQVQITARAGSWDYYRVDADVTGPLNENGTIRGRLVAGYEDRHYFYDNAQTKLPLLYGIVEADLGTNTVAAAGFRYQTYKQNGGRWAGGLGRAIDGSDLKLPRSTSLGPSWTFFESEAKEIFGDITHYFNDDWKVKLSANYQSNNRQDAAMMQDYGDVDPATLAGLSLTGVSFEDTEYRNKGLDAQLNGKFDAWGQQHEVFIGANWQERKIPSSKGVDGLYSPAIPVNFNNLDLSSLPRLYRGAYTVYNPSTTTTSGIYGNVKLQLIDEIKLILGGRVSWYEYDSGPTNYKQTRELTPYLALIYKLNENWSLYGSYTDIFRPQSDRYTASGNPLEPATGSNYEAGIKGEFYDGKLNTSFNVFRINMDDIAQTDPRSPNICPGTPATGGCSINGGKLKSEGWEAEINGEVLKNLQLSAGYTFNEAKYVRDRDRNGNPTASEGRSYNGSFNPRHLFRTWATYRLSGDWEKVTVGGGVTIQSDTFYREGNIKYQQGGYSIWSAHASYRIDDHWTAALNINNLFDKRYYTGSAGEFYGEPQSVMLTVRGNF